MLENWNQKVSETLKVWVLSQIKPLISHLNVIVESYDTESNLYVLHLNDSIFQIQTSCFYEIHISFFI